METERIIVPVLKPGPSTAFYSEWSNEKKRLPEPVQYGESTIQPSDGQIHRVNYASQFAIREQLWTVIWVHLDVPVGSVKPINFRPVPRLGPVDVVQSEQSAAAADLAKLIQEHGRRLADATPDMPGAKVES